MKANNKTKALLRIRNFLSTPRAELICKSYITSCFDYCPLIWMFCNKTLHQLIVTTHKRALRAVEMDFSATYEELLTLRKTCSIHNRNLLLLVTEVYKSVNNHNPEFMGELFVEKDHPYKFRSGSTFSLPKRQETGTNSLVFRACLAWNTLPKSIKKATSVEEFVSGVRNNGPIYCKCKICI